MSVQLIGSGTIGGIDEGLVISGIVTATELDISGDINVHNTTATSTTDPVTLDLGGQFTANASITQANLKLKLYHNGSNGDAQGITASASGLSYVSSHTTDHIFYTVPSSINSLVERLRINSSGFIGMGGNTNPTNVLHIKTAVTNTAVATIESTATNSYPFLRLKNDAREYQLTCHGGLSDAFTIYDGTSSAHRLLIDSSGNMSLGYAGSPETSNGNVTKTFGIRSTQNNVLIGETSATSEHTGFIFEARQTGRSGTPRIAQINMGNDAGADGRIKFSTAPDNADVQERFRISNNGIRAYASVVDTSYHANPDPLGDGSGIVYYRLNDNFHDHGIFAQHATGKEGGDPTFALVNSTGEKCWQNPVDGAIQIPNLKNSYPFSMAAWINVSSWPTSADNDVIMNLSIGNVRVTLCICCFNTAVSDGADFYIMYGGQGHHYFRPTSKPTNTWFHVVYSVVGADNGGHRVYQNGADLTTRGNRGGGHGGSAGWRLGGNANGSERFAIGRIGSIRFFNKALSASEANTLYQNDTFYT